MSSVVVLAAQVEGVPAIEPERQSILLVHPDAEHPSSCAFQRFESVAWWIPQLFQTRGRLQIVELPPDDRPKLLSEYINKVEWKAQ